MKLKDLYPRLSQKERHALAKKANTDPGYLWQLATGWRGKKPSLAMIERLANADRRLTIPHLVAEFASSGSGARQ
ncbi:hypothetical protein ACOTI8_30505 [Achromobacter xylosoxidans]